VRSASRDPGGSTENLQTASIPGSVRSGRIDKTPSFSWFTFLGRLLLAPPLQILFPSLGLFLFQGNRAGLMKKQNSEQGLRFSDTLIILLLTFSMFFTKEASFFSTEFAF
jgi:hypothetical protein